MEKEPKKRGRKPKQNKNISIQTNHDIKEEFIVKLDINNIKHDIKHEYFNKIEFYFFIHT